jgi:hypothetical protein
MGGPPGGNGSPGAKGLASTTGVQGTAGAGVQPDVFSSGGTVAVQSLQIVITGPPHGSLAVGQTFGVTVAVEDGQGDVDTGFTGPISVELISNPGGVLLTGTLTENAVNGVATFAGLSLNKAGNGYQIVGSSGGVASTAVSLNVSGATSSPTPTPSPRPTQVLGSPALVKTKKGITGISVAFTKPLNSASASNPGLYHILKGVRKKKKTVYSNPLKIQSVSYSGASDSVTVRLAKPYKGTVEVAVDGAIEAMDGTTSLVDFSTIVSFKG